MFGRATITLGIGPHSSCIHCSERISYRGSLQYCMIWQRMDLGIILYLLDCEAVKLNGGGRNCCGINQTLTKLSSRRMTIDRTVLFRPRRHVARCSTAGVATPDARQ